MYYTRLRAPEKEDGTGTSAASLAEDAPASTEEDVPTATDGGDINTIDALTATLAREDTPPADPAADTETETHSGDDDDDDVRESDAEDTPEPPTEVDDAEATDAEENEEPDEDDDDTSDDDDEREPSMADIPEEHQDAVKRLLTSVVAREKGKVLKKLEGEKHRAEEAKSEAAKASTALEAAQKDLTTLRARKVIPAPNERNPFTMVQTTQELEQMQTLFDELDDWIDDNPEGGMCENPLVCKKPGEPVQIDEDRLATLKKDMKRQKRALPKRREYIEREAQFEQVLAKIAPSVLKEGSPLNTSINQAIAALPEIKHTPAYRLLMFYGTIGRTVVEKKKEQTEQWLEAFSEGKDEAPKPAAPKPEAKNAKPKKLKPKPVPAMRSRTPIRRKGSSQSRSGETRSVEELTAALS